MAMIFGDCRVQFGGIKYNIIYSLRVTNNVAVLCIYILDFVFEIQFDCVLYFKYHCSVG